MRKQILDKIVDRLRQKYSQSVLAQLEHLPSGLTKKQRTYIQKKLKTKQYYVERKRMQLEKREQLFFETFTLQNPYRSKDQRELLRAVLFQHCARKRILTLLKQYVIPCSQLSSVEMKILTDQLLISVIDKRLRPYFKVRATKLGSNSFAYYLMKENWKRESVNHMVWKFEIQRLFHFRVEQQVHKTYRVDLLRNWKSKRIVIEIVCSRQAIDESFKRKVVVLAGGMVDQLIILAPTRLHKYLASWLPSNVTLLNAKSVLQFCENLFADK